MKGKLVKTRTGSIDELIVGVTASILMMLFGTSFFALLITKEVIEESNIGYCALAILLISSISGTVAIRRRKTGMQPQKYLTTGAIYFVLLSCVTMIFFGAKFQGVFVTSIVVISGCLLPAVLGKQTKSKRKAVRSKMRRS